MSGDQDFSLQDKVLITSFAVTFGSATEAIREFEKRYNHIAPPRTTIQHW